MAHRWCAKPGGRHAVSSEHRPAPWLLAHEVSVRYGSGTVALQPSTLRFEPGSFTVLLGPSGAGKSTLLRVLNGLVPATTGHVARQDLGPVRSAAQWRQLRRDTGMVFQQHHLIGRLSVLANVLLGRVGAYPAWRSCWPLPRAEQLRALEALERVGLLAEANRRADQLSGGQQQRVGIARALVQRPRVLLADEPVASLDPASAEQALRRMHDICRADGLTAIVSLHQVALARQFADRLVGLRAGRVVVDTAPQAITVEALHTLYGPAPGTATRPDAASDSPPEDTHHAPSIVSA
ncbi:MAG: phosphonate ABC transporter ATP-binding protein [Burkholderiales bacterium]|nr:phosphonate ABC transporter ATP-binding protein [Burkholderiales bacterium]